MCEEPRISKKQMADFIRGIPISDSVTGKAQAVGPKKKSAAVTDAARNTVAGSSQQRKQQKQPQQTKLKNPPSSSLSTSILVTTTNAASSKSSVATCLPSTNKSEDGPKSVQQKAFHASDQQQPFAASSKSVNAPKSVPAAASRKTLSVVNPYLTKKSSTTMATSSITDQTTGSAAAAAKNNTAGEALKPFHQEEGPPAALDVELAAETFKVPTSSSFNPVQPPSHPNSVSRQQQEQQQPSAVNSIPNNRPNQANQQKAPPQQQQQQLLKTTLHATPITRPIYKPGPVPLDVTTASEWIYPTDDQYPKRQYQFEIARTAVLHNTLVGLPTGLGKTLIAAVVMYNYYRWFPTGKVVFMAPTLPLVNQQVKACYDIMGIPEQDTAVLTGKMLPQRRASVWTDRRAFFCTPQTMQKDIDQGRVDPKQFVLVVFDEAHRTRGDYSYNKIVHQLEEGGAQFRVLGLSATPGSQIKTIQEVVNSLRINKVECRSDDDADVKRYVHDRQTEVVLVKQQSACRQIESTINDILEPELLKLRRAQAFPYHGNATVTQWLVVKARTDYVQRTKDYTLNVTFEVVRTLVEMRSTLHQQGVGVVRGKLMRLRDEKKRCVLAQITGSERFAKLMELVLEATCDPSSSKLSVAERVMNNPKLQKLQEILIEHFERARLSGSSSRAIVFSQFRDSVAEIVTILGASRPMVRPRHFVGQGKGSSSSSSSKSDASSGGAVSVSVKGMTQAEQHQVIKQFREDVYNVLVCTCIGEEGLDIGEVDLIVNFDSLQSPVRMLQRVGRTGRKRDGRVVFLVAEGAEEKTHRESKIKERTVIRAMKRPDAFTVTPTIPMLPATPAVCEQNMKQSLTTFRMTQVEGHGEAQNRKVKSASSSAPSAKKGAWKLSDDEEARRAAVLGDSNKVRSLTDPAMSSLIKKRTLMARSLNTESFRERTGMRVGRTSSLLRNFERNFSLSNQDTRRRRSVLARGRNAQTTELCAWFPINSSEDAFEAIAWGKPYQRMTTWLENEESVTERPCVATTGSILVSDQCYPLQEAFAQHRGETTPNGADGCAEKGLLSVGVTSTLGRSRDDGVVQESLGGSESHNSMPLGLHGRQSPAEQNFLIPQSHDPTETAESFATRCDRDEAQTDEITKQAAQSPSKFHVAPGLNVENTDGIPDDDVFRLPTPSTSSDEESDEEEEAENPVSSHNVEEMPASNEEKSHAYLPNGLDDSAPQDLPFFLPTQSSSSSSAEDDSSDDAQSLTERQKDSSFPANKSTPRTVGSCSNNIFGDDSDMDEIVRKIAAGTAKRKRIIDDSPDTDDHVTKVPRVSSLAQKLPTESNNFDSDEESLDVTLTKKLPIRNKRKVLDDSSSEISNCEGDKVKKGPKSPHITGRLVKSSINLGAEQSSNRNKGEAKAMPVGLAKPTNTTSEGTQKTCITISVNSSPDHANSGTAAASPDDDVFIESQESKELTTHLDDIVCAICQSGDSPDEDPIYLCDGPGNNVECNLAVHATCYSVAAPNPEDAWRCDPCEHRFEGGSDDLQCAVCDAENGPLKEIEEGKWVHSFCREAVVAADKIALKSTRASKPPARRRPKKMHYSHFLEEEASIASDEDMDGDDGEMEDVEGIEEEEKLHSSFINDSSQLGYSPDEIENVDPEEEEDYVHRLVDHERDRRNELKTPVLNRRMAKRGQRSSSSHRTSDASSTAGSEKGLGGMHFIRSVIEHHRQGGTAEQIEELYEQMEAANKDEDDDVILTERHEPTKTVVQYAESDDEWPE
ncbi:hypothetical protein ACA910_022247 [Epithemia clementina (nom. ined.)]